MSSAKVRYCELCGKPLKTGRGFFHGWCRPLVDKHGIVKAKQVRLEIAEVRRLARS